MPRKPKRFYVARDEQFGFRVIDRETDVVIEKFDYRGNAWERARWLNDHHRLVIAAGLEGKV